MHLSRILDQIKRHPSPTEALTKLGKAMDKHEDKQTQNIVNQIKPCPVPAYLTCNPYGCNGGFTGYGNPYGYGYGYGDSCCA